MEIRNAQPYRTQLVNLLSNAGLPFEDLPQQLDNFIVAIVDHLVAGAAGMETYGDSGLLRSVVVKPAFRGKGIANELLKTIETLALDEGVNQLILLTETAKGYFENKGFHLINREEVPEAVKASTEFSHVCPVSAIVMSKTLITHI